MSSRRRLSQSTDSAMPDLRYETNEHIVEQLRYSNTQIGYANRRCLRCPPSTRSVVMPRIPTPDLQSATGATAEIYAEIKKAAGSVPNTYAVIGALEPAALKAILQADSVLGASTLSKQDQEAIKLTVSEVAGCDYCMAAHTLLGKLAGLKPEALRRIRNGQHTGDVKRDALLRFVRILAQTAG